MRRSVQVVRIANALLAGGLSVWAFCLAWARYQRYKLDDAPTQAALDAADTSTTSWLTANHGYRGFRYSPLSQINRTNVSALTVVCQFQLPETQSLQSNPLVVNGVLYVTTPFATAAIDATTCKSRWVHDRGLRGIGVSNRGAAIASGVLVRGTPDGWLMAFNATNGRLLWERQVADSRNGETLTMPPLIRDSTIFIGPAGSENGMSGWIGAFRLQTGDPIWRFQTVDTSSWAHSTTVAVGGGSVWTPAFLDPQEGTLFAATTNPAPSFAGDHRPGNNLFTNSLVALDTRTGHLRWYRQIIPHDTHDWDVTQAGPLLDSVVITAGKDGMMRAVDRRTHDLRWQTAVTTQQNVTAPITTNGTFVCPGVYGGVAWNGAAFSLRTGLLYVPAADYCTTFYLSPDPTRKPGTLNLGGAFAGDPRTWSGWITAVRASDGVVAWRYRSRAPVFGAVIATGGGVVFAGEMTGDFLALDDTDGRVLFRRNMSGPIGGGVVTYSIQGKQYIALVSGMASSLFPGAQWGKPTITVFDLRDR